MPARSLHRDSADKVNQSLSHTHGVQSLFTIDPCPASDVSVNAYIDEHIFVTLKHKPS